jgi:hypothetical protein
MKRRQVNLATILLLGAALPIWLFLFVTVPFSTGWGASDFRFLAAPLVLVGTTFAVHRLVRRLPNAWGLAMLLAAVIALASLSIAFAYVS